jgi:acetyl esterase/lipase
MNLRHAMRALLLPAGLAALAACAARTPPENLLTPAEAMAQPRPPADYRIEYGPDSLQFGELRLPRGQGPFPVAVVIHGGCWRASYASHGYMSLVADTLRRLGYATWNIEYRAVDRPGGGWPGTLRDVAAAADFVRDLASRLPLDTARVLAIGHDSGGEFALWLAARHRLGPDSPLAVPDPLPLLAVISLGGPGDLRSFVDTSTVESEDCGQAVAGLLGGVYDVAPDNWHDGSPSERLPLGVPQRLVAGEWDPILTPAAARSYVDRARLAGDDAAYVQLPGVGHFEMVVPGSKAWAAVERVIQTLVPAAPSKSAVAGKP